MRGRAYVHKKPETAEIRRKSEVLCIQRGRLRHIWELSSPSLTNKYQTSI